MKDTWKRLYAEADEGGGGTSGVEEMAALQAQIDALKADAQKERARADEQEQSARYWHEEAKKKPAAAEVKESVEDDTEDPIELLSKGGTAALDKLLEKRGFVKGDAVGATVEQARQQLVIEAALAKQFPEITDQSSDFFKQTTSEYATLVKQGTPHIVAMQQAPKNVRLAQIEAGTYKTPAEKAEREERAAAAGGDKSKKGGPTTRGSAEGEESDEITPFEKIMLREMCPENMKLEDFEKSVVARGKQGINYRRTA